MTTTKRNEPVATFGAHADDAERPDWALTAERVPLFSYVEVGDLEEGDDGRRVVDMPAKPNPGLGLEFLRKGRTIGAELAISWLIEEAIGPKGYDALVRELGAMPDPENGTRVLQDIGQRVQQIVMGGLEGPKA